MGEQLHFSIDGEFLTAIARDWFWKMDKPYKKCEELLLSCMMGGNEEEKRHVCQDIIEGRKKLVGVNEFELVDDNVHVRSLGQKVEELQHKMLVNQIREDKKELNVNVIKMYCEVMPVTHAIVEVGSFDTMLVKAIEEGKATPESADYQKGPRYKLATLREAVFYRDNYTCQVCGRKANEGAILHVHHMFYWKGRHGNSLSELVTVCEKCHTPANHQKGGKLYGFGEDIKFANLSGAAFMNTVRWQIVNELYAAFGKPFVTFTYGAMTKEKRIALHLEKSHNNDAYAMGSFHPVDRCAFEHYEKVKRNNRILEKFYDSRYINIRTGEVASGKELFNGRINRNHKKDSENLHKYRGKRIRKGYRALRRKKVALNPGDLVSLNGEILTVHGTHTKKNGSVNVKFKTPSKSGKKSTSLKKLKIIKTISPMRSAWDKVS